VTVYTLISKLDIFSITAPSISFNFQYFLSKIFR